MMDYTPSRTALGASSSAVEKAIEFANKGGIVTFCWHWNAPTEYLNSTANSSDGWWGGFYTQSSKFDIAKVMNGQDAKGKKLLDRDIKEIAKQLKRLEKQAYRLYGDLFTKAPAAGSGGAQKAQTHTKSCGNTFIKSLQIHTAVTILSGSITVRAPTGIRVTNMLIL